MSETKWEFKGTGGVLGALLGGLLFCVAAVVVLLALMTVAYVIAAGAHAGWE